MKKILIVSRSFYPENSPRSLRATELAKEFSRQGNQVTVLTPKDSEAHSEFSKKYGIQIKDLGRLKFKEVVVKGVGFERLLRRAFFRLPSLLLEYPGIELMPMVKKALKKEKDYDLLVSIAVPYLIHWGVAGARSKKHPIAKTWVADCGDPYMGQENDSFNKPFYFKFVEKWFCRKADFLAVPFEGAKKAYYKEFQHKIRVIPQGFTFPEGIETDNRNNNPITFAYSGNISSYRHYASDFLEYLNTIDVSFKFLIYTKEEEFYQRYLTKKTLSKCEINDYIPRMDLLSRLNAVDFLVHFPYENKSQKSLKLIDYHFLKKPILSYTADKKSKNILMDFLSFNYQEKMREENIANYRIKNVVNEFLKLTD